MRDQILNLYDGKNDANGLFSPEYGFGILDRTKSLGANQQLRRADLRRDIERLIHRMIISANGLFAQSSNRCILNHEFLLHRFT